MLQPAVSDRMTFSMSQIFAQFQCGLWFVSAPNQAERPLRVCRQPAVIRHALPGVPILKFA